LVKSTLREDDLESHATYTPLPCALPLSRGCQGTGRRASRGGAWGWRKERAGGFTRCMRSSGHVPPT
jgi:hypothetical protein